MKKILAGVMASCMLLAPTAAFAASTGSVDTDAPEALGGNGSIVGDTKDTKFNKQTLYGEKIDLTDNEERTQDAVDVYCVIDSVKEITLPKTVILDGSVKTNATGTYVVGVKGDIAGDETISITPAATVSLASEGKDPVDATITQEKKQFALADGVNPDTYVTATGTITASLTAGHWNGQFNFTSVDVNPATK